MVTNQDEMDSVYLSEIYLFVVLCRVQQPGSYCDG